jgi:parvulin-like peptidyl-prolyl isomerase
MTLPRIRAICRMAAAWAVAACLVACATKPEPPVDPDVVVATVDGARISLKDLKTGIARIRGITPAVEVRDGTRTEVSRALRQLIERAVVLQEGERLGVEVTRAEVEEEVKRYRADFPPGGLDKALLQGGIDAEEWREDLRQSILYRKSVEAIARPLAEVEEQEVKKVYRETYGKETRPERIRVRQFLFDSPETAARARKELTEGASPDSLVKQFSSAEGAPLDIDLGFLTREELPEEVAEELFGLLEGGVSGVIRRDKTYSIFLVVRKSPSGPYSYAEKAPELRRDLLGQRREEAFRTWLDVEVGKAHVKVQEEIVAELMERRK